MQLIPSLPPEDWRRPRGRPRITWLNTIQQDPRYHNLTLPEAMDMAQNRSLWRMWSTYGATQSWVACQKWRRRRRIPCLPRPRHCHIFFTFLIVFFLFHFKFLFQLLCSWDVKLRWCSVSVCVAMTRRCLMHVHLWLTAGHSVTTANWCSFSPVISTSFLPTRRKLFLAFCFSM